MAQMNPTPLFGGALQALIPTGFLNASTLRSIPDNQEVFLASNSDISLIIELLDMDPEVSNDEMLSFHLNQIMGENEATNVDMLQCTAIQTLQDEKYPTTPMTTQYASVVFKGSKFHEASRESVSFGDVNLQMGLHPVLLLLGIIRIPLVKTDLLVSMYFPNEKKSEPSISETFQTIFTSIQILDWGLFADPPEE